jgi:catalase-peroxidase
VADEAEVRRQLSWADLMVLTGNVALESMGFKTFGFAGGRTDDWEADLVYWGPEKKWLADERYSGDRKLDESPRRGADGPHLREPGRPERQPRSARGGADIRETFGRMAMNDEETVALIAGGHTFGKAHGAHALQVRRPSPPRRASRSRASAGRTSAARAAGADTITSGLEGAWTVSPDRLDHAVPRQPVRIRVGEDQEPGRARSSGFPERRGAEPGARCARSGQAHAPIMFTTDLALKDRPAYRKIAERFRKDPQEFADAFARPGSS